MFAVANKLYGITMHKRTDIPLYHPQVETYEVKDVDGTSLGILYLVITLVPASRREHG